jgi:hypothetical protein
LSQPFKCPNCQHTYPGATPNFCVKCGHNLSKIELKPVEKDLYPDTKPVSTVRQIKPTSVTREQSRGRFPIQQPKSFKVITNEWLFIFFGLAVILSSNDELFLFGWIGLFALFLIYGGLSKKIKYIYSDRSNLPIILMIIALFVTLDDLTTSFFTWSANLVLMISIYYFQPPKEISEKYPHDQSPLLLVIGQIGYVFFALIGGSLIAIIAASLCGIFYIYSIHAQLKQVEIIHESVQPRSQQIIASTATPNLSVLSGVNTHIDTKGGNDEIIRQLGGSQSKLINQYLAFESSLNLIEQRYTELQEIIDIKFPAELKVLETRIDNMSIRNVDVQAFKFAIQKFNSQIDEIQKAKGELITNYHENYNDKFVKPLEELLEIAKQNQDKLTAKIESTHDLEINNELAKIKQLENQVDLLYQKIIDKQVLYRQEVEQSRIAKEQEEMAKVEVKSFKLQTLISEKVISNLFAYAGAAFIIAGFLFLLTYTYNNYILENFPETAPFNDARFGVIMLYTLSILIITVPGFVLDKIGIKFRIIYPIFMSAGILFLQLTLFVQSFWFQNLDFKNASFTAIGTLIMMGAFIASYKWKSQLVALTATEFGIWLYYISSTENLVNEYLISLGFLFLLVICFWLVYDRQLWIPLAAFSLFTPVLWTVIYDLQKPLFLPEYLTLGVTLANIGIAISKKMPTPKPFSNFLATVSLIYPNIVALQFTIFLPSSQHLESFHGISSIIIVLTSFFILYWVYVLHEEDISFDFSLPVSYKFREEQVKYQRIEQKLNWLMLSSLLFLMIAGLNLWDREIYTPLIFFAAFMAVMSNIAMIKNFEKLVKNSTFLFIFAAQMFYILNLYNPKAPNIIVAILSAVFLISFTYNFQLILKLQNEFNLYNIKLKPYYMGVIVAISASVNYIIGSFSDFESIVLFVAVIQWIIIIHSSLLVDNKTLIHRNLIHVAAIAAPLTLFVGGLLRQSDKFTQDILLDKIMINSPLILIVGYVIYISFRGNILSIEVPKEELLKVKKDWKSSFISPDKIYVPQILLFILPNVLIIYGKPYFFFPEANQAILMIYMIVYFLLLPILFIVSERRSEKSFSILSSFWGYFSFLLAFVLLGGAKQVYDKIIKPPPSNVTPQYIIPLEWAIFLFVVVFIASVTWTLSLSQRFDNTKASLINLSNPNGVKSSTSTVGKTEE